MTSESISKIILSGEHSVVYGYPAIAIPVKKCKSFVSIKENINENINVIKAPQISKEIYFDLEKEKSGINPLEKTIRNFLSTYKLKNIPNMIFDIYSDIPIASGMGSGASISTSIIKELSCFFDIKVTKEEIYELVMETEKIYHGNPSGIDPMVIVHEKPIFYIKNKTLDFININKNLFVVIIDTGIRSSTKKVVDYVREQLNLYPNKYNKLLSDLGIISSKIKDLINNCSNEEFFDLINENHKLLKELGISNNEIEELIEKVKECGADAIKISGAGKGGVIITFVTPDKIEKYLNNLQEKNLKLVEAISLNLL